MLDPKLSERVLELFNIAKTLRVKLLLGDFSNASKPGKHLINPTVREVELALFESDHKDLDAVYLHYNNSKEFKTHSFFYVEHSFYKLSETDQRTIEQHCLELIDAPKC